ncbi:hypothetical protein ACIGZJ_36025 [Kitasatospora sp. NPDC052868]|uniref:hypothetical protein n=1 Tax=Kitasatospora sp. NPDC052868 TaxID=3364060 RepID=UPI0037C96DAD
MLHEDQLVRPWGTVSMDFWAPPAEAPATEPPTPGDAEPEAYRERLTALSARLTASPQTFVSLQLAAVEARELASEAGAALGTTHPYTIGAHDLQGWIAHVQGRHGDAARWHLHTAGLHATASGVTHQSTVDTARRAYGMWQLITDPAEQAAVGQALMPMLTAVLGAKSAEAAAVAASTARRGA